MRSLLGSSALALALTVASPLLLASGCGTSIPMTAHPSIPFAEGRVEVSYRKDGTGDVKVLVSHLGDAGKLDPATNGYVVWLKASEDGAKPQNVGFIDPDHMLRGSVGFETTLRVFDVFLTPEPSRDAEAPTGRAVLSTSVDLSL